MTPNIILLLTVLTMFSSCNGQNPSSGNRTEATVNIGNPVSDIDKSIWVIYQDKKNNYWFGSNGNGAYCFDGKSIIQFTTKDGLYSNQIRGIQEDKSGNLFFDTPKGVTKFDGVKFSSLIPFRSQNNNWKMHTDDLWFKGNGDLKGAYRYDGKTLHHLEFSAFDSKPFSPEYAVYSIYKDNQGNIWFGTLSGGVCRFDGVTLNWIQDKELSVLDDGRVPGVRSIVEDKDGFFWFSNIISRYRIEHNDWKSQKTLQYEKVKGIELSQQQSIMKLPYFNSAINDGEYLWMTSYNEGVWKYDGNQLTNYQILDGETKVLIVSIYKDSKGVLWLGTDNSGVYRFNDYAFEKFVQ